MLITANKAFELIRLNVKKLHTEFVSVDKSTGRVFAEDIQAPTGFPVSDNSSMDGYALRSKDTANACKIKPVKLKVVEEIPAGNHPRCVLAQKEAARIFTGAMLPDSSDCVIMHEEVAATNHNEKYGLFLLTGRKDAPKHANAIFVGEHQKEKGITFYLRTKMCVNDAQIKVTSGGIASVVKCTFYW